MKKEFRIYPFLLLCLSVFYGCDPPEENTALNVSPFALYIPVESNEVVSLEISCDSKIELKRLLISSQVSGGFSNVELDSTLSDKSFNFRFQYLVPVFLESKNILLDFSMEDAEGNVYRNAKMLEVTPKEILLAETTGHEFFSAYSDKQDAYNLFTQEPLYSELTDSAYIHLRDASFSNRLERKWLSPAGITFVKFNDFDYANCTNISVRNSFIAGSPKEFADDLVEGDILLLKYTGSYYEEAEIYMAIKIISLFDEYGSDSDRYIFNLKK